jgi:hypothetical protein
MKPATPEPADLVPRLRQQLILAQVRVMELEDVRENLGPRLAELDKLLAETQTLADLKTEEATHLGRVLADLQAQFANLNQVHQLAAQDLAAARASLAETNARLGQQTEAAGQLAADRDRLATELRTIKTSRSWRWTAWLRTLGGK